MTERIWDKYLSEEDKAVFASSGFGSLADWGKRPALLIIDVNYAFCDEKPTPILESIKKWRTSCGEYAWEAMPVLQKLIETCRGKGIPIIYTTGTQRPDKWDAGSWAWKSSRPKEEAFAAAPPIVNLSPVVQGTTRFPARCHPMPLLRLPTDHTSAAIVLGAGSKKPAVVDQPYYL